MEKLTGQQRILRAASYVYAMIPMFCQVSVANVMKEPGHRMELHTQLLYGDPVVMLEKAGAWSKIRIEWDRYIGWVLSAQLQEPAGDEAAHIPEYLLLNTLRAASSELPFSELYPATFLSQEQRAVWFGNKHPDADFMLKSAGHSADESLIRKILSMYLHAPYMWGGNTPAGIDCSGLSQMLYRFLGISLPHFASEQMEFGRTLDFLQEARAGDLAFFASEEGEIQHVGVLWDSGQIIHASESNGRVAVDILDQSGILNPRTGRRTHELRVVKRYR